MWEGSYMWGQAAPGDSRRVGTDMGPQIDVAQSWSLQFIELLEADSSINLRKVGEYVGTKETSAWPLIIK